MSLTRSFYAEHMMPKCCTILLPKIKKTKTKICKLKLEAPPATEQRKYTIKKKKWSKDLNVENPTIRTWSKASPKMVRWQATV